MSFTALYFSGNGNTKRAADTLNQALHAQGIKAPYGMDTSS